MKKLFIVILILINCKFLFGQSKVDFQIGYSNLEHLSTGIGLKISEKHKISFLLGTNCFADMNNFVVYSFQYEFPDCLNIYKSLGFNFGLKTGYSIYSNKYYKWDLISISPNLNLKYRLNENLSIASSIGLNYSKVLKQKRIGMGEIGWYKEYLPEIKLSLLYGLKY